MDFRSFYQRYTPNIQQNHKRVFGKYMKYRSMFGASENFQQRLVKRSKVIFEIQTCRNLNDFFMTKCRLIPGVQHTSIIFHVCLLSDPTVEFVVKDTLAPNVGGNEDEDEDEDEEEEDSSSSSTDSTSSIDSVESIGSNVETPEGFHSHEGDIMMFLTEKAIEESFENMLLGYYYDGRFLCMERAKGDYKGPTNLLFKETVFEIALFLHRHGVRHGDWLIPGMLKNNLFELENSRNIVIGDFGNSSHFANMYERLNDIQHVVAATKPASTLQRLMVARDEMGLPDPLSVGREIGNLTRQMRALARYEPEKIPGMQDRLKLLSVYAERFEKETVTLSPEEHAKATALYESIIHHLAEL